MAISDDDLNTMLNDPSQNLGKGDAIPTSTPQDAINRVASKYGINPDYLMGLAKLETAGGKRMVGGTNNLFNIKDISGNGVQAYDKMEKSRDKYKKYDSYDQSVEDFVAQAKRKWPGALTAKTPEEFANALNPGKMNYATDVNHSSKVATAIKSFGNKGRAISDSDLEKMLNDPTQNLQIAPQTAEAPSAPSPKYRKGFFGEQIPIEDNFSGDSGITTKNEPLKVAASSAIHTGTLGFVPEWSTAAERARNPMSQLAGGVVGTLPLAYATGGQSIPTQMAIMGGAGATQALNEGKSFRDVSLSGALGAISPAVGAGVGKIAQGAGNLVGKAFNAKYLPGQEKMYGEAVQGLNAGPATPISAFPSNTPSNKTLSQKAIDFGKSVASDITQNIVPSALLGAGLNTITGQHVDPITAAQFGAGWGTLKGSVLRNAITKFPDLTPAIYKYVVANLPANGTRAVEFINLAGEAAKKQGKNAEEISAIQTQAAKLYEELAKRNVTKSSVNLAGQAATQLTGQPVTDFYYQQNKK